MSDNIIRPIKKINKRFGRFGIKVELFKAVINHKYDK